MKDEQKQDRIEEGRRLQRGGAFDRLIQTRSAHDFYFDEVTLECGHKAHVMPRDDAPMAFCMECAEAWLKDSI